MQIGPWVQKWYDSIQQNHWAHDAEQLIAKSHSYVEHQTMHMRKRSLDIINLCRPSDCPVEQFRNPFSELEFKLLKIGNPMPNIMPKHVTRTWQ